MDGLQPVSYSTGNPQINFIFYMKVNDQQTATYMFKSWDIDSFQPQQPYSDLSAHDVTTQWSDQIPPRVDDAQVLIGDSISTWGNGSRNTFRLSLNGFVYFEGWVDASQGCPSVTLSGTWTQTV